MKKVGILVGREQTFPESIIKSINEKGAGKVTAELITIGGIRLDERPRETAWKRISGVTSVICFAKVEATELIVERWLIGRPRHRRFYSLAELNAVIRELLHRRNEVRSIRRLGVHGTPLDTR